MKAIIYTKKVKQNLHYDCLYDFVNNQHIYSDDIFKLVATLFSNNCQLIYITNAIDEFNCGDIVFIDDTVEYDYKLIDFLNRNELYINTNFINKPNK